MTEYDNMYISYVEYMNLYRSLIGDLDESIKAKGRSIKYHEAKIKEIKKDIKDIDKRIESIKKARTRAEGDK